MMINIVKSGIDFEISYEELSDILKYITDEFTDLIYDVDSSIQSSLIFPDEESFVITFSESGETLHDLPTLYYLEPTIFNLIDAVDSQLNPHGLYVSASDFGEMDCYYELVVSKIGHTPKFRDRYAKTLENATVGASTSGSGGVSSASVSSTSTSASTSGSGDISNTLKVRSQKMGGPSQVSDLRFLKPVKIKKVKDI
jgi:hypothetical protein